MSKALQKKPNTELQKEISQIVATVMVHDLKGVIAEIMEKIFTPIAQMEIIARKSLLTEKEAGLLFSVSPATLRSERSRGTGPGYIKDGKKVLYKREDLEAYYDRLAIKRLD